MSRRPTPSPASAAAPTPAAPKATAPAPSMPPADGGRGVAPPLDLARRAVACRHWRWLPGMRVVRPDGQFPLRIVTVSPRLVARHEVSEEEFSQDATGLLPSDVPDLTDPATLGCLLAVVREAWGRPDVYAQPLYPGGWAPWPGPVPRVVVDTEVAALVAALEAAP